MPVITMSMSTPGRRPTRRIIRSASSNTLTCSPIWSASTSWPSGVAAAWSTRRTASSVLMNQRVIRGSVTVTGPPAAIWRWKVGITLPRLPSTLPNRTAQ